MGILGWPPSEFWAATPSDLFWAMRGWHERQGDKMDVPEGANDAPPLPISLAEFDDMMARFPDQPAAESKATNG